jgi:hypothetical protein
MTRGLRVTSHIIGRKGALGRRVDADARELALRHSDIAIISSQPDEMSGGVVI